MRRLHSRLISRSECFDQIDTSLDGVLNGFSMIRSHTQTNRLMVRCSSPWVVSSPLKLHFLALKNLVGYVVRHPTQLRLLSFAYDETSLTEPRIPATCISKPGPHPQLTLKRLITPEVASLKQRFTLLSRKFCDCQKTRDRS